MGISSVQNREYSILVGVDYSDISALALTEAIALARAHQRSHIHVVHSIPGVAPIGRAMGTPDLTMSASQASSAVVIQPTAEMSRDVQTFVEKMLTQSGEPTAGQAPPTLAWTTHLRMTDPTHAIVQLATDIEADLVVVGTHSQTGLSRFLLGSVAEAVVRLAPCPVLVVRARRAGAAAVEGPQIEPACPQCLETRRATEGSELWCERHREHHERAHTYHFTPFRGSHQSGLLLHPLK